ncbi:hypothetical protein Tco_0552620, partial [Tanacetum coccineum]
NAQNANSGQANNQANNGCSYKTFQACEPKEYDGKRVEVDRIFLDCKLELGNSLLSIDLIPLGHGSFDVIVGMDCDWLDSHRK